MPRKPAGTQPVETPTGRILTYSRQRDPKTVQRAADHVAALSARRWIPPAKREA